MQKILLSALPQFTHGALAQATQLTQEKKRATILALEGELGAGKTTFTQALARELGVGEVVQSPTYVLMKQYQVPQSAADAGDSAARTFKQLIHIDAYRLEEPAEFATLKPESFLNDQANLVVVEWPEHLAGVLPAPDLTIRFSADGARENERFVEIV